MNGSASAVPTSSAPLGDAGAPRAAKRDTFGGGDGMAALTTATNAITIRDGMPVSKSVWPDNKPVVNGTPAAAAAAAGADKENTPVAPPILAQASANTNGERDTRPTESPALDMPGGPPVNRGVTPDGARRPLPPRPSRSYVGQQPAVVTQYERPLDEQKEKRPPPAARASSRKSIPRSARESGLAQNAEAPVPVLIPPPAPASAPVPVPAQSPFVEQQREPVRQQQQQPQQQQQQQQRSSAPGSQFMEQQELNDYDRIRASFYSVPDPTRPETAQAYREYREQEVEPKREPLTNGSVINAPDSPHTPRQRTQSQLQQQPQLQARPSGHNSVTALVISEPIPTYPDGHVRPSALQGDPSWADRDRRLSFDPRQSPDIRNQRHLSPSGSMRDFPRSPTSQRSPAGRLSPSASYHGGSHSQRLPSIHAIAVGEVVSLDRQRQLQASSGTHTPQRHSLHDPGPVGAGANANLSPVGGPASANLSRANSFGFRPQPVLVDGGDFAPQPQDRDRGDGVFASDPRGAALIGRSNTSRSRATTLGRNGTLSRASNGGTVGRRSGAFGMGAGLSVGTQPEEVLGRDDIHQRAQISDRQLDADTLRRLSQLEKKDAKKLEKLMKEEERAQAKSLEQSIHDLKRLSRMQREAITTERKSQSRLSKWTSREHQARMRFLKEKERYEKVEGELKNAENDYEERRDHAAGLTAQIAERTQEIDDMRAQKAADDRERRVKKQAMRNPAYA